MPKVGVAAMRKRALIRAAITEVGRTGSLDVTVSQIAGRAGVSSALAHHYFGSKEQIFLHSMRHILSEFRASVRRGVARAEGPRARIHAIVAASFEPRQFEKNVVAAWLAFYVEAQRSREAARLLRVYARRLHSNFVFYLRKLISEAAARKTAQGMAAMIDGFYIRCAMQDSAPDRSEAKRLVADYLDMSLECEMAGRAGDVANAGAGG